MFVTVDTQPPSEFIETEATLSDFSLFLKSRQLSLLGFAALPTQEERTGLQQEFRTRLLRYYERKASLFHDTHAADSIVHEVLATMAPEHVPLAPRMVVCVHGLKQATQYNGRQGRILAKVDDGRLSVQLVGDKNVLSLKP